MEELTPSMLAGLIGVFLAGLLLVVLVKGVFSTLQGELWAQSSNERARLFIGDEIVRGIQEIEKDAYQMTTLTGRAAITRKEEQIRGRLSKLEHDLGVLKGGGTVQRVVDLNMEGRDQMAREVHFRPQAGDTGYVMELIEISPQIAQVATKTAELRGILMRRLEVLERGDTRGFYGVEQEVYLFLKRLPPLFLRMAENANRLFFEASERLAALETRLEAEQRRYQRIENLLVLGVIIAVTLAGIFFALRIRASNRRLRHAWVEMRLAKEGAERASRAKSDFVSRMSHELRTPLNAILGFAQLLHAEALDPERRDFVQEIKRAGGHLLELINQVLDLAKIEAGSLVLEEIPFDLMRTVDEVAAFMADRARLQNLQFRCFVSPEVPTLLMGDPTRLRQVLINLVGNAMKFTHEGWVELSVVPAPGGDRIAFCVTDTGIGMDGATLERLFQPFSQADESTTRKYGGTGLGLMISRDLVRAMGGDIGVTSTPGEGSSFQFSLPIRLAEGGTPPRGRILEGHVAVLLGDLPGSVDTLEAHLESLGAAVTVASDLGALPAQETEGCPRILIGSARELLRLQAAPASRSPLDVRLLVSGGDGDEDPPPNLDVDGRVTDLYAHTRLAETLQAILKSRAERQAPAPSPAPWPSCGWAGRILLVEDNRINQMVAGRMLERIGVHYDLAGNGREALAKLGGGDYRLVLMDMQMPEMDGLTATRALRERELAEGRSRTPVVAMTANAMNEDRARCLAGGMDDHLAKPVEMEKLLEVVSRWIPREP